MSVEYEALHYKHMFCDEQPSMPGWAMLLAPMTSPEQKLWVQVLLDGLAKLKGVALSKWVQSADFETVCKMAGVRPELATRLPAARARKALRAIRNMSAEQALELLETP